MRAETPKRYQVQIRRVQHHLDPNQHQDRVTPRQRTSKTNGEQQRGNHQI
jgi:hypothetical protein